MESHPTLSYRLLINTINDSSRCAGQFQVEVEDDQNPEDIDHVHDKGSDTQRGDVVEGGRGEKGSGKRGTKRDGENGLGVVDDEIISPASYVACFVCHPLNDN